MIIRDVLGIMLFPFFCRICSVAQIRLYQTFKIVKYYLPVPYFVRSQTDIDTATEIHNNLSGFKIRKSSGISTPK